MQNAKNITEKDISDNVQLALDTIHQRPTQGIPSGIIFHVMEHREIERLAGAASGSYVRDPETTDIAMLRNVGICVVDQYLATNPLSMGAAGYEGGERGATTGAEAIELDGILIDSPEAVVRHLEEIVFPKLARAAAGFNEEAHLRSILEEHREVERKLGPGILKTGYGFVDFPRLAYGTYGYGNYFMAYSLYPDIMERHFALQADLAVLRNRAAARAFSEGPIPPLYRLDHDIADSRGTLVDIKSLDRTWLPHFTRAIEPMLRTDVRMIWHCDGNLMQMVPRLLDAGIRGFQGFQYENRMDYERICRMKSRDGAPLLIVAGVSVTRTLPNGTPDDVRREMKWLVENGPPTGLFLGSSSSIAPGVPPANLDALVEGIRYYRTHGRG